MNWDKFYAMANRVANKYESENIEYGVDANNPDQAVIIANWNNIPDKLGQWFEDLGAEAWWSDQFGRCDHCGNFIDENPTHYGWEPPWIWVGEGYDVYEQVCRRCVEEDFTEEEDVEEQFGAYIYNYHHGVAARARAIPSWSVKLFENTGWNCWSEYMEDHCERYETGFHPGQNDDPKKIATEIWKFDPDLRVVFAVDSVGQFDVNWHVLVKPIIEEEF